MPRGLLYRHRVPRFTLRRRSFSPKMWTNLLLIILCHQIIGSMDFTIKIDNKLDEGDQCTLENGSQGICKKLPECSSRLKEVEYGKRTSNSPGRCGFDKLIEIVCCPVNVTEKIGRGAAETACQEYRHTQLRINGNIWPSFTVSQQVYVFGGTPAKPGEFPYMVALGYKSEKPSVVASPIKYTCGGSLISLEYVLTAAHCVNNIDDRVPVEVRLGNVNIHSYMGSQRIPISNIISHPRYRRSTNYNDVAILKLKFKAHISITVMPICLETKSVTTIDITPSTHLVVVGWGVTDLNAVRGSDMLMKTPSLRIVKNEVCNKSYSQFNRKLPHGVDGSMICVADPNSTRMADACSGDSGGPLLLLTESGVSVIGITAFGSFCGTGVPAVYTAIYPFLDWIEEHVWPSTDRNGMEMQPAGCWDPVCSTRKGTTRNTYINACIDEQHHLPPLAIRPLLTGRSELTCANLSTSLSLRSDSSRHFGLHAISLVLGSTPRGLLYRHRVLRSSSRRQLFSTEMCNIRPLIILKIIITSCHLIGCMRVTFGNDGELDEGDQCTLENGSQGICKKLPECSSRLKEVEYGERTSNSPGRCGFDKHTEIVCCPVNVTEKIGRRPAETACQQYDNAITINGRVQSDVTFHIFGGVDARAGEFPYMVALGYTNKEIGVDASPIKYTCGGSLISSEHVLTAAHCVNNIDDRVPVEVRLGNVNINSNESTQRIPISDIISHPQYRRNTNYNDVAILKLKFKVQTSPTVKPVCLQTKSVATVDITPRTPLVVIGWGATDDDFELSDKLMRTPSLSLVNSEECSKSYSDFSRKLPRGIDSSMICARDTNETRRADACSGDSGGPLLMLTESGDSVIGVTAFGQSCGSVIPGVYTAVYSFLDWIEEHVWPTTDRSEERAGPSTDRDERDEFPMKVFANFTVWFADSDE
ncbi:ovochymase-2 [Andrena cerasifolii]|uniref:ovochymase-2 n=1 Tax=Andrena cerasifolii TaxID=2819439 RepID=UPI0040376871